MSVLRAAAVFDPQQLCPMARLVPPGEWQGSDGTFARRRVGAHRERSETYSESTNHADVVSDGETRPLNVRIASVDGE
jgi:hypothetical protein